MTYSLFLDDERSPKQVSWVQLPPVHWTIVRNYKEFVHVIATHGMPARVTFDHDLSIEHYPFMEPKGGISNPNTIPYGSYTEKTGYDCAMWLVEYCIKHNQPFPEYYVHTMNPIGKTNIISLIECFKRNHRHYGDGKL